MKTWLILLLLSALFTGCNSGLQTTVNENELANERILEKGTSSMNDVSFTILKKGQYPEFTEGKQERTVYYSDNAADVEAFQEAYLHLTNTIAPEFDGTMIIAQMGQKNTGGYDITVESVKDSGRFMEVTLHETSPKGLVTMALTNPYIVINLPENHKEIKIIEK